MHKVYTHCSQRPTLCDTLAELLVASLPLLKPLLEISYLLAEGVLLTGILLVRSVQAQLQVIHLQANIKIVTCCYNTVHPRKRGNP